MRMTPGELIDKYTIAVLYVEREGAKKSSLRRLKQGVRDLKQRYPTIPWKLWIKLVQDVNGFIWDFESPIHTGKFDSDPVMVGILSIRVRKFNVVRVSISKLIDELVKDKYK